MLHLVLHINQNFCYIISTLFQTEKTLQQRSFTSMEEEEEGGMGGGGYINNLPGKTAWTSAHGIEKKTRCQNPFLIWITIHNLLDIFFSNLLIFFYFVFFPQFFILSFQIRHWVYFSSEYRVLRPVQFDLD